MKHPSPVFFCPVSGTVVQLMCQSQVKTALASRVIGAMTITEVRGFGRQKGHKEIYRGSEYTVDVLPKVKLEIVSADDKVESVVKTIIESAKTGKIGDGKVFVYPISEAYRIRTEESNEAAV